MKGKSMHDIFGKNLMKGKSMHDIFGKNLMKGKSMHDKRENRISRTWYRIAVALSITALTATACGSSDNSSNESVVDTSVVSEPKEPIVIGLTTGLTGPAANFARYQKEGLELAVEEINAAGGIDGHEIKYVIEDNQYDTALGVSTLQKLISVDKVVAFVTIGSSIVPAQAPIFKAANVICLSTGALSPAIADVARDTGLLFSTLNSSTVEVEALAKAAFDDGVRKMVTLVWNNDRGLGAGKAFATAFTNLGGTMVGQVTTEPTAVDYRAELTKLKGMGAEGVYVSNSAPTAGGQLAQAKQLGINVKWFGDTGFVGDEFFGLAGDAAIGAFVSRIFDPVNGTPEMQELGKKIQAKTGAQAEYLHATTYDAIKVFALAATEVSKAGKELNSTNIVAALHAIKGYPGATGVVDFDEIGMLVPQPVLMFKVADAKGTLVPLN